MKSINTAATILNKLYKGTADDIVLDADTFIAFGKNSKEKTDIAYVATQLSILKSHGLITTQLTEDWPRKRKSVTLTEKGKQLRNGVLPTAIYQAVDVAKLIDSVSRDVETLRKAVPTVEFIWDIKLAGKPM